MTTALIAAYHDIRWRKIPNWLVLAALAAGLTGGLWRRGLPGLVATIGGFVLALIIYFPLYLLRGIGAGDVKLMAALGAVVEPRHWLLLFLFAALFGAIAGLLLATAKGKLKTVLLNTGILFRELLAMRVPHRQYDHLQLHHPEALRMPHGVAIAVGTAALVLMVVSGGGAE